MTSSTMSSSPSAMRGAGPRVFVFSGRSAQPQASSPVSAPAYLLWYAGILSV